ncbi:MAG: BrnT family toxin [Azoarcus sp.]|jgi:uncharacterized DUF497 family protein|nr:BrnT family toxin [Azoarcus sp.]
MEIEFDPVKDALNQKWHGLSLSLASSLDWDYSFCWEDDRSDYGEQRFNALVPLGEALYHVTYVERHVMRVISLREADNREKRRYVGYFF